MRIKIKFGPNTEKFSKPTNDYVNGFVHNVLGKENKWHDSFSPYSIYAMHGGNFEKESGMIQFPNGGYFIVSSDNEEFISDIFCGLASLTNEKLQSMPYAGFETYSCGSSSFYDVIRAENVRVKDKNKEITINDEQFVNVLLEHAKKKLINCGISEEDANSLKFEPFHKENWKVKMVKMKYGSDKQSITPSSTIMLVVKGKKIAREKLISLGLGNSTGSGFGFITTKNDNK